MKKTVEQLRQKRLDLLEQCLETKTQYAKNLLHRRVKAVNKALFKETKNPIYL
jgi:hypothetical protein